MNRLLVLLLGMTSLTAHAQIPDYVPTEGLVGLWLLNGDANDESGNGNHGLVFGAEATTDRFGNPNEALLFTVSSGGGWGAAQQRVVISNPTIPDNNSFTMSSWVKLNPKPSPFDNRPHTIMGRWNGNGQAVFRHKINYDGEISTQLLQGDSPSIFNSGLLSYDEWQHVVITYDGDTLRHYLNGDLVGATGFGIVINTSTTDLTFGELHMYNGHWYLFSGKMDDCGYWSRALSESEITTLFDAQLPMPGCTDLTACNFNEEATDEDGSCVYPLFGDDCETGGAACGEGTIWDSASQSCVAWNDCPSDLDGDDIVGVNDLLTLLADFGTECPPEETEWTCGDPVNYHGYDYATVQIGEQCWFAENLRTEQYQNGDSIPGDLSSSQWTNTESGAQAVYADDEGNLDLYGRLYNGYAMADVRALCPTNWHVPSDTDWGVLELELGLDEGELLLIGERGDDQGTQLKASTSDTLSWDGTNTSGFSAVANGYRHNHGYYQHLNFNSHYWSQTASEEGVFYIRGLQNSVGGIYRLTRVTNSGYTVRCVAD